MVRDYQADKARKLKRLARDNSQNIANMFARVAAPQQQQQQQAAPAAAAAGGGDEEEPNMADVDESIANADDGDGGGDDNNNDNEENSGDGEEDSYGNKSARWQRRTLQLIDDIKKEIEKKVQMTGREDNRHPTGRFPREYAGILSPSDDPITFFGNKQITTQDFCHPDLYFFWPEALWPEFYPRGRPKCKFHNTTECCKHDGWMLEPRSGYRESRLCAIIGRKYYCKTNKKAGGLVYNFRGIDEDVIKQDDSAYVMTQWKMNGFDFSHRAGISNELLEQCRRRLIEGLSVSGFRNAMMQGTKQRHMNLSVLHRSYFQNHQLRVAESAELLRQQKRQFPEYDSEEYQQSDPSVSYIISRVMLLMESSDEYKTRRMQMVDGRHAKGDHSFKIIKCVSTRGKPFTAVYCLLNEYSQVMGWWMTTGTSMEELEEPLRKVRERLNLLGYPDILSVTTDRCCQERAGWNAFLGPLEDEDPMESEYLQPGDTTEIEVVDSPFAPILARTVDLTVIYVGEISAYLKDQPPERQVIIVDGEWVRGNTKKMDLLIITLLNGRTYLFHLAQICRRGAAFPLALKILLEDPGVKKVGNRINTDVSHLTGWNVNLNPTVELGHLAKARCISSVANPSLAFLCETLFPGVVMEGKDTTEDGPRISNWADSNLSEEQKKYATNDGYGTRTIYLRIMQHMDPRVDGRIRLADAIDGLEVTVYVRSYKTRLAKGVIRGTPTGNKVIVEINLADEESLYCKSAIVNVVKDDGSVDEEGRSLDSLRSSLGEDVTSSTIKVQWDLSLCRRTIDPTGENVPVTMNTKKKQVVIDDDDEDDELWEAYDADDEVDNVQGDEANDNDGMNNNEAGGLGEQQDIDGAQVEDLNEDEEEQRSDSEESDGNRDRRRRLPKNLRLRLHQLRKERVKNDILHIFLRQQRVLSKEHGAYFSYITALRDAMFILNDEDLEVCLKVLREKRHMSESEIRKKMTYDFEWFALRVRRLVPPPPVLAKRYLKVFEAYKDIICHKSGKPLFATPAAMATHKATLKHIRRNCLSDIPFVTYYTPLRKDRDGLTRWRCHRGTSANEGLHQKLRQLVRGFSNSPRFLKAIISEYLLRWNQNIDVKTRGLPSKYDGLYDGVLLEDEIEELSRWLDTPVHDEWVSSRSFMSTGETFGIITPTQASQHVAVNDERDDPELVAMAKEAADDMFDDEVDGNLEAETAIKMPPSSQWLALLTGRNRPAEGVRSAEEWDYFKDQLQYFQGGGGAEADNYSGMRWSAMARSWNEMIDRLGATKPTMTYKSASHLQHAFKIMRRRAVQQATLRQHSHRLNVLHEAHTNRDNAAAFGPHFTQPEVATVAQPAVESMDTEEHEQGAAYDADLEEERPTNKRKKTSRPKRCRMCGKEWAHTDWAKYHVLPTRTVNGGRILRDNSVKVWDLCTVPEEQREDDFPFLDLTKRLPKRK